LIEHWYAVKQHVVVDLGGFEKAQNGNVLKNGEPYPLFGISTLLNVQFEKEEFNPNFQCQESVVPVIKIVSWNMMELARFPPKVCRLLKPFLIPWSCFDGLNYISGKPIAIKHATLRLGHFASFTLIVLDLTGYYVF
jgi:hypothetical protein